MDLQAGRLRRRWSILGKATSTRGFKTPLACLTLALQGVKLGIECVYTLLQLEATLYDKCDDRPSKAGRPALANLPTTTRWTAGHFLCFRSELEVGGSLADNTLQQYTITQQTQRLVTTHINKGIMVPN